MDSHYFTERGMVSHGSALDFVDTIHALIAEVGVLEDFSRDEITTLSRYMPVFEAPTGTAIITEGEAGDFMILVIRGLVDIFKRDRAGQPSRIAVVKEGYSLGEMSMLDGEPRFCTCTALEPTLFAVLSRASLAEVIRMQPGIGAKILVKLVQMLSQRLRNTSMKLVACTEKHARRANEQHRQEISND